MSSQMFPGAGHGPLHSGLVAVPHEAALVARDRLHVAGFAEVAMVGAAPLPAAIPAPEQAAA